MEKALMNIPPVQDELEAWFESDRDYISGLHLFLNYTSKRHKITKLLRLRDYQGKTKHNILFKELFDLYKRVGGKREDIEYKAPKHIRPNYDSKKILRSVDSWLASERDFDEGLHILMEHTIRFTVFHRLFDLLHTKDCLTKHNHDQILKEMHTLKRMCLEGTLKNRRYRSY